MATKKNTKPINKPGKSEEVIQQPSKFNIRNVIFISSALVVIGLVVIAINAATPSAIVLDPKNGTVQNNANVTSDNSAASGGAVQFANLPPKNSYVIYSSAEGQPTAQVWRMKADGSEPTRLTNDTANEIQWARPSLDGQKILFTKAPAGQGVNASAQTNTLWTMNADGTNQQQIISADKKKSYGWTGLAHPEWSPDSSRIVLAAPLADQTQLFIVDANGNSPQQITSRTTISGSPTDAIDPSWGVGDNIMFIRRWNCFGVCGNQAVYKLNLGNKQEVQVASGQEGNDKSGIDFDPYLSPDGSTYMWLHFRCLVACPTDVYVANANGAANIRPLIADGGTNSNGTFSADSKTVLFLKTVLDNGSFKQRVHRINSDGTGLKNISITNVGEAGPASYWP